MTKEIAIHNLFALKLRSRVTSDREALDMGIKALEQTRWIPCSEKQPKKNGNYHVTVEANDGTASIKYQTIDHYGPKWLHDDKMRKVIAWRPLPETYEESEEEGSENECQ